MSESNEHPMGNPGKRIDPPERPPLGAHATREGSAAPLSGTEPESATEPEGAPQAAPEPGAEYGTPYVEVDSLLLTEIHESKALMRQIILSQVATNLLIGALVGIGFVLYLRKGTLNVGS